jgi:hypothetical protein
VRQQSMVELQEYHILEVLRHSLLAQKKELTFLP